MKSWTLVVVDGVHTCIRRAEQGFASFSTAIWLDANVSCHLTAIAPRKIKDLILHQFGAETQY